MTKNPTRPGREPEDESEPEKSGPERSAENEDNGPKRLGGHFLNGVAEGVGQAVGVALAGFLIAGLVAGGVIAETQSGPHQEGGAAVNNCM
ncbi:hypothetical protein ACWGBV_03590 [Streptomyces sp. NPDC055051]